MAPAPPRPALLALAAALAPGPACDREDEGGAPAVLPGDADGDGVSDAEDCEPEDPEVHPGATERCNGIDDDCDPSTGEEGLVTWFPGEGGAGAPLTSDRLTHWWVAGPGADTEGAAARLAVCPGTRPVDLELEGRVEVLGVGGEPEDVVLQGSEGPQVLLHPGAAVHLEGLVLDGRGTASGVRCTEGASLALHRVVLQDHAGSDGAAVSASDCALSVDEVLVTGTKASEGGGGIDLTRSSLLGGGLELRHNTSLGEGGGLRAEDSSVELAGVGLEGNHADAGGGMLVAGGSLALSDCVLDENTAGSGGGLYALDHALVELSDCELRSNSAESGGHLEIRVAELALSSVTLTQGVAHTGAALTAYSAEVDLGDVEIQDAEAGRFGAVYLVSSTVAWTGGGVSWTVGQDGPAVYVWDSSLVGHDLVLEANANLGGDGGALFLDQGAVVNLEGSRLVGNVAAGHGGAAWLGGGSLVLQEARVEGNYSGEPGVCAVDGDAYLRLYGTAFGSNDGGDVYTVSSGRLWGVDDTETWTRCDAEECI